MAATRTLSAVLLCALGLFSFARAAADEHVLTLDASNFDEEVKKHEFMVVEFYAPWCGHCKQLAPQYEAAAKVLKDEGSSIVLAKVDADEEKNKVLGSRFGIRGFPTLKIFRGSVEKPEDYEGPRDSTGIVAFVKKLTGPASRVLEDAKDAEKVVADNQVVVVGVFSSLESPELTVFASVANSLRSDYTFVYTTDPTVLPAAGTKDAPAPELKAPAVRIFKKFDTGFEDTTALEAETLTKFITSKSRPLVLEMGGQDSPHVAFLQKAFEEPSNKTFLFLSYQEVNVEEYKEKYAEQAKQGFSDMVFIVGDSAANEHALKYFGLEEKDTPLLALHDPAKDDKYSAKNIEPEDIATWVKNFRSGALKPTFKSEPIPTSNDGPVKVIVGDNFKEEVFESGKNVFLKFYAPWCGHCKTLAPIYEEAAKEFASDPSVVFAKFDATANDMPTKQFPVKGFPTLFFYTSAGDIETYQGERTKEAMVEFVNKHKTDISEEVKEAVAAAADAKAEDASAGSKDEL